MKWLVVVANLIAAAALILLGDFAVAAHRTHAYSTYIELRDQKVLAERPDYDVKARLRTIADGGMYSMWVAEAGSAICLANSVLFLILLRKTRPTAISNH